MITKKSAKKKMVNTPKAKGNKEKIVAIKEELKRDEVVSE
jgi:hypothetical protein